MVALVVGLFGLALIVVGLGMAWLPLAPLAAGAGLVRLAFVLSAPARPEVRSE